MRLEGERFLIQRARAQHPDFPDSVSIIGVTERDRVGRNSDAAPAVTAEHLTMHYFDSRGVFRVYRAKHRRERFAFHEWHLGSHNGSRQRSLTAARPFTAMAAV